MGIVIKQTSKNIFTISVALVIGAINTLYFYPEFLKDEYYGLVVFLLATSNLLQPIMSLGAQHTIIKFYSSFKDKVTKDAFLSSIIFIPLIVIIPVTFFVVKAHDLIGDFLSLQNPIIESYVWVIFLVSFATSYFEVFYAWSRVQLKSVFGNVLKEIYPRISVLVLLILVSIDILDKESFVWWLTGLYYLRLILMILYSFSLYIPRFSFKFPDNYKEILSYSIYILLAGSAASLLIDIDKYMIPQKQAISQTAYYAVAVFIATVVEIPGRAMFQILNPMVAKAINNNDFKELNNLYQKSSSNLLILSGFIFLIINLNISSFYLLMNNDLYSNGIWVWSCYFSYF
jgi:O-antigen/teichoic acid export membrane protein